MGLSFEVESCKDKDKYQTSDLRSQIAPQREPLVGVRGALLGSLTTVLPCTQVPTDRQPTGASAMMMMMLMLMFYYLGNDPLPHSKHWDEPCKGSAIRPLDKNYYLNQQIQPGILIGFPSSSKGIKESNSYTAIHPRTAPQHHNAPRL